MYLTALLVLTALPALSLAHPSTTLEERSACDSHACVTYYSDNGCTPGLSLGSYKPDCSGHCFQYNSFSSIQVGGSIVTGADCIAYSDGNCQNEIGDSGNQHGPHCFDNLNRAQSMKCYYGC